MKLKSLFLVFLIVSLVFPINLLFFVPTVQANPDETAQFYVDNDMFDGYVRNTGTVYLTVQSASVGDVASNTMLRIGQDFSDPTYSIWRGFLPFDTSSLSGYVITSAKLCLGGKIDVSTTDFTLRIQNWTEFDETFLSTADYDAFDGVNYDDGNWDSSQYLDEQYNNITITDFDIINQTGNTTICLRSSRDISQTSPSVGEYITFYDTGESLPPFLEITYQTEEVTEEEDIVDNNTSDVDSHPDNGTHSDFTKQQDCDNNQFDNLTEANTGGAGGGGSDILYVDGFNSVNEEWDETGASPWLNDNSGNYISTNVDEEWHEEFTFANHVGGETLSSVELCLEIQGASARNDYVVIDLYDGSSWNNVANQDPDNDVYAWFNYSVTSILNTWTKVNASKLRVQYQRSGSPATQTIYIRRSCLNATYGGAEPNYELDLEIQWTNINYTRANENLSIATGAFNGSETLMVYAWNVSTTDWHWVMNLTANTWNNVSVSDYLNNETFTVRFLDAVNSSDTTRDAWQIDCSLVHSWEAGQEWERDVSQTISFAFSVARYIEVMRTGSQTLTFAFGATGALTYLRYVTQTLSFVFSSATLSEFVRGASQTLTTSFDVARLIEVWKTATQSIGFSFEGTGALTYLRYVTQTLSFVFSSATLSEFVRSATQTLSFDFSVSILKELLKSATQTIGFAFSGARVPDYIRTATQTIGTVFSASSLLEFVRTGTQNIVTSFGVSRLIEIGKSVTQTLSFVFGATGFKSYAYERNGTLGILFFPNVRGIFVPPNAGLAFALIAVIIALFALVIGLGAYVQKRK